MVGGGRRRARSVDCCGRGLGVSERGASGQARIGDPTWCDAYTAGDLPFPHGHGLLREGRTVRASDAAVPDECLRSLGRDRGAPRRSSDAERTRGIDTTIPPATRLASLEVESGTATLALNARQAVPTALDISLRPARAAQIVYTLTALPDIERVLIHVNGVKRATFIGADLVLGGAVDQRDISSPVQLPQRPANVPVGPAPVDVRGVQKRLQELSYLPRGAAIGAWDDRTNQAVLAFQGWHGLTRDGIVGPHTTAALESAAAPEPRSSGAGRRIEVHRDAGVVLLIDGATVVRAVHASTGGPGYETPAGSYSVFRKEMNSWSVPYQVWLPYASYFNGGIAFHASNEVPQRPVSHGCVRLPVPEAAFVYDFAAVGTSVVVY